jgi:hypothetical protein
MAALTTIYWFCFGVGLVYVLVAGTLGAVSHGIDSLSDIDTDVDHDFDVDHDAGFDVGADHDIDVGAADFDVGVPDADLDVDVDAGIDFDVDADIDVDTDVDHDPGGVHDGHIASHTMPDWNPFSPLSIAGFLCAFGGGGLLATGNGLGVAWGLVAASISGLLMALVLWLAIGKFLFGMQGSSHAREIDMLGIDAEVLTPVEHDMCGEIAYILEGVRYTAPARLITEGRVEKRQKVPEGAHPQGAR